MTITPTERQWLDNIWRQANRDADAERARLRTQQAERFKRLMGPQQDPNRDPYRRGI